MSQTPTRKPDREAGIRDRLNSALAGISHTEIARRVGINVSSVNRYLRGAKLPADFVASVTEAFALNPAWTLAGEGHSRLDAVSADTTATAEKMLTLVQSLRAVMRQRLGALLGDRDKMVLADLSDALNALDKARTQLSAQSKPVMADLLKKFYDALAKRDAKTAAALEGPLVELSRLVEDEQTRQSLLSLRGNLAQMQGNMPLAVDLHRRAFLSFPTSAQQLGTFFGSGVHNLVMLLHITGRGAEALKVARAARILLEGSELEDKHVAKIQALEGLLHAEFFHPRKGVPLVADAFSRVEQSFRDGSLWPTRVQVEYLAGITDLHGALATMPRRSSAGGMVLFMIACLEQNREVMTRLLAERVGDAAGQTQARVYWVVHARAMLAANPMAAMQVFDDAAANKDPLAPPAPLLNAGVVLRRADVLAFHDEIKAARLELDHYDDMAATLDKAQRLPWPLLALYHRLRLRSELATARQQARARRFFKRAIAGGCRLFEKWIGPPAPAEG
ncbi:MAG: winged helix-turn-helix domain-containing protein [Planctomycetes bacterium]|nr:winged helix-turn-helix domain-containing protein [Planctomycetota bacterium]